MNIKFFVLLFLNQTESCVPINLGRLHESCFLFFYSWILEIFLFKVDFLLFLYSLFVDYRVTFPPYNIRRDRQGLVWLCLNFSPLNQSLGGGSSLSTHSSYWGGDIPNNTEMRCDLNFNPDINEVLSQTDSNMMWHDNIYWQGDGIVPS